MKKIGLLLWLLLVISGVALATPRDDLFAEIHDVSEPLAISIGPNQFNTQALRLLDDIATNTAGGGGGGGTTNITGVNGVAPSVGNGATDTGTLRVTISSNSTGTVAITASSLPLPTGASTAAKQPALGTAGTASADVLTVQGIASMTALKTDGSATTQPVSGTVTANAGTNLNTSSLALDATLTGGTQKTKLVDAGGTNVGSISAAGALKVDGSAVIQPVSGTVTTTPPSNASTNVAQVAGTTTDTNSGVKSAGTIRVVLATDQPQLTNKLLVTPDSVALPANQSINESQINGVTPLMGNGVTGTGSQRVNIASDNTAFPISTIADKAVKTNTGNITAVSQTVGVTGLVNQGTIQLQVTGTYSATLILEGTADGVNYNTIPILPPNTTSNTISTSITGGTVGEWVASAASYTAIQVRCSAYTSGTGVVTLRVSEAPGIVYLGNSIPTGSNSIGAISTVATVTTVSTLSNTTQLTPGTAAANLGKAEDAASANGDTMVAAAAVRTDTPVSGANASASADYVPIITDSFGRLWIAAVQTPVIDQGLTQFRLVSAATTNATVIKASQGNVYNIEAFNNGAAAAYLKFYNSSTSPTVGTTTTTKVLMIPAGGGLTLNSVNGIQFSAGISFSIVTNLVDTDATAIAINQVSVNIDYK